MLNKINKMSIAPKQFKISQKILKMFAPKELYFLIFHKEKILFMAYLKKVICVKF